MYPLFLLSLSGRKYPDRINRFVTEILKQISHGLHFYFECQVRACGAVARTITIEYGKSADNLNKTGDIVISRQLHLSAKILYVCLIYITYSLPTVKTSNFMKRLITKGILAISSFNILYTRTSFCLYDCVLLCIFWTSCL